MTDEQIIIDDQKKTIHRLQDECTEKTNAIIALGEQLKAKEQECEELKAENNTYKSSIVANLDKSISKRYRELLEENDQLKETIESLLSIQYKLADNNKQLRQTLAEIKEICKTNVCKHCYSKFKVDDNYCKSRKDCDCYNILQKINEAEDEG